MATGDVDGGANSSRLQDAKAQRMKARSYLFVPADSARKIEKALACGADALIFDLEDSVAPQNKPQARQLLESLRAQPASPQLWVRVNPLGTPDYLEDLQVAVRAGVTGLVLPKPNSAADVDRLGGDISELEISRGLKPGAMRVLGIITETAAAVLNAHSYGQGSRPRLHGVTWGAEDLAADIGASSNKDAAGAYTGVFRQARTVTLLAAAAAQVQAIDAVYTDFRNPVGLAQECKDAVRDGFVAKMAIHPDQISVIHQCFTPSDAQLAQAQAIVDVFAQSPNAGVLSLNGKMLDRPHLLQAQRTLAQVKP
jgi:citrate lyase subunit beta / citryl-CoA lyase